jgi:hypothetical protein
VTHRGSSRVHLSACAASVSHAKLSVAISELEPKVVEAFLEKGIVE